MSDQDDENNKDKDGDPSNARYSYMMVNADEMEYLQSYWEIRDVGELFGWAWRLLHDLTKADEMGWALALQKAEIDEAAKTAMPDPNYRAAMFRLKWMVPESDGFYRIPVDQLEKLMRKGGGGDGEEAK